VQDKNIFGDDFQLKLSVISTPLQVWWGGCIPGIPPVSSPARNHSNTWTGSRSYWSKHAQHVGYTRASRAPGQKTSKN